MKSRKTGKVTDSTYMTHSTYLTHLTYLTLVLSANLALASPRDDQATSDPAPPAAIATRVEASIHIDGRLDEPAWQQGRPMGPLLQRDPLEAQPPSEDTEVRVLFDDDALYFGVSCFDRTPAAIVATQLTRDADLGVDDHVLVILDPFSDYRNGFFFAVNPLGARLDGQVSNNAESLSGEWDGIWYAAARIDDRGWTAEIAIPFKTLRFKPGQTVWGVNIQRHIKRRDETDRWSAPRRDVWIGNLSMAGRLEGLEGIRQGRGLDIRPYLAAGDENGDGQLEPGIDVSKNLTPNLNASLTVNTDFAETEADTRQVNLTRFPLFFPEKRSFFLEGAGVFDVAGLAGSRDLLPFFSRRIGLLEGEEVPILAGAKMIGRAADYNVGVLDVRTRDLDDQPRAGQNLLAARVSRNVLRQSWIGGIFTHGNPSGAGGNTLVGVDARFATSTFRGGKNLSLDLYAFRTADDATDTSDAAGGFRLDYPNDLWDVVLSWKQIGGGFRPALGFVPRRGIRKTNLGVEFKPRPHAWGIRQFFFEFRPEYITNLENRVENWRLFTAPINLRTESGEHLEWNCIPEYEHLDVPFEISPGIFIPPGSYQWTRYRAEVNTATKRPWVIDAAWWWGSFYNGTRRDLELGLTLKPNTHVALAFRAERNDVSLDQGDFFTEVLSVRGDYNFSPDVSWANLIQYDNESRVLGVQSRFRWIIRPGNDLFLVVNRGWFRNFAGVYEPSFDKASVKAQYTFRL